MRATTAAFVDNSRQALGDARLQKALANVPYGFQKKRQMAKDALPEFDRLRDQGRAIKDHTLAHLDLYLEHYRAAVEASGGHVHLAETPEQARAIILKICQDVGARTVTKGKSMVSEEIAINDHLAAHGITPVETDLGEYIIQLRHEPPSHIIAPAIHLNKEDVEQTFRATHTDLPADRDLSEARLLVAEARGALRQRFVAADVGITGANFLVAETGSSVIVTNEGNGDLTQNLPRVHIVIAGIEKLVPTLADTMTLIRLLARSATGQEMSVYTTFSTGPRRQGDVDGPEHYHVVLLDNGRGALLGSDFQDVLRCIRCGSCMNHCPVYASVGGHAYGWVYPGPIGAVITPALIGLEVAGHLPNASTFCGRCEQVCPMMIPLPRLMRHWRERQVEQRLTPAVTRAALGLWAFAATRPALYRRLTGLAGWGLRLLARGRGRLARVPLAGGWTAHRDLAVPPVGGGFLAQARAQGLTSRPGSVTAAARATGGRA